MRRTFLVTAVAFLSISSVAGAQRRASTPSSSGASPVELGMDAALTFGMGAPAGASNTTTFELPLTQIRAGFFVSPELSIEPSFGIQYASANGASSSLYHIGVGALYHFSTVRSANQVYVRPFINFENGNASVAGNSASVSSTAFGAGLGIKMPMSDRMAWRFEANLAHNSNNNFDDSPNRIGLLAGLSYFTH